MDLVLNWFQRIIYKDFLNLLKKGRLSMLDFSTLDAAVAAAKTKLAADAQVAAQVADLQAKLAAADAQAVTDQAKIAELAAQLNAAVTP